MSDTVIYLLTYWIVPIVFLFVGAAVLTAGFVFAVWIVGRFVVKPEIHE